MIGSKGYGPWQWGLVGTLVGTDSSGVEWAVHVYECPLCAALVPDPATQRHQDWHRANHATPVRLT